MIKLQRVSIGNEELDEIAQVLATGNLTQGTKTQEFEHQVKDFLDVKHALAMSSATTGLNIALDAIGVGHGDEVIVPAFSFPATANSIIKLGATPVFVDINPDTYNIDVTKIREKISHRTKAIMPVHAFGLMADMKSINEVAFEHDLFVVEDAACAMGATQNNFYAGTLGDVGVFSFHPRKVITTGEGGMVVTSSDSIAEAISILRSHGSIKKELYLEFIEVGYNYRLSDVNSAIGVAQMRKLSQILKNRLRIANIYNDKLRDFEEIKLPYCPPGFMHSYQSFVIQFKKNKVRDKIISEMAKRNIETTLGTYGMHLQPIYQKKYSLNAADFPNATIAHNNCLTLPLHFSLSAKDLELIVSTLKKCLSEIETA